MQEALGADFTDFNRIAHLSSFDPDTDRHPHSISGSSFTPPIQAFVRRANVLNRISHGRRSHAARSRRHLRRSAELHRHEFGIGAVFDCGPDRSSAEGALPIRGRVDSIRGRGRLVAEGQRASGAFRNMIFGFLCVCHSQFQNEVIGG
ncbi:MAG: hypothetical protein WC540_08710 [Sulfuritalea sp.]